MTSPPHTPLGKVGPQESLPIQNSVREESTYLKTTKYLTEEHWGATESTDHILASRGAQRKVKDGQF